MLKANSMSSAAGVRLTLFQVTFIVFEESGCAFMCFGGSFGARDRGIVAIVKRVKRAGMSGEGYGESGERKREKTQAKTV